MSTLTEEVHLSKYLCKICAFGIDSFLLLLLLFDLESVIILTCYRNLAIALHGDESFLALMIGLSECYCF